MTCPVCGTRKARRACPAIGAQICPVCCGTKRLVEINCPSDCPYLTSAQAHPPAAVRRQRERDIQFALGMLHDLSEPSYRLVLLFQDLVRRYRPTAIPSLVDTDVAEACASMAATLETSGRGIIFEHHSQGLPAQRLVSEFKAMLGSLSRTPSSALERDAAVALRRMEQAARGAHTAFGPGESVYLDFLGRMPEQAQPAAGPGGEPVNPPAEDAGPRLIIP